MSLRRRLMLVLGALPALNACVLGAETRASRLDVATGPAASPARAGSAAGAIVQRSHPGWRSETSATSERRPLRVASHAHWNGVRYIWVESAEAQDPCFRWR
jgi:hypothetical protein